MPSAPFLTLPTLLGLKILTWLSGTKRDNAVLSSLSLSYSYLSSHCLMCDSKEPSGLALALYRLEGGKNFLKSKAHLDPQAMTYLMIMIQGLTLTMSCWITAGKYPLMTRQKNQERKDLLAAERTNLPETASISVSYRAYRTSATQNDSFSW